MLNCVTPEILFHFWVETSLSSWTIYIKAKCIDIIFNPFLISGVVTWVYYQALLTSRLSMKVVSYPFHDIPSFSQSNYR